MWEFAAAGGGGLGGCGGEGGGGLGGDGLGGDGRCGAGENGGGENGGGEGGGGSPAYAIVPTSSTAASEASNRSLAVEARGDASLSESAPTG